MDTAHIEIKLIHFTNRRMNIDCETCKKSVVQGDFAVFLKIDETPGLVSEDAKRSCCQQTRYYPRFTDDEEEAYQIARETKERLEQGHLVRRAPWPNPPEFTEVTVN